MEISSVIAEWVAAVGTVAAFGWAVFLYGQSLRDKEVEQARLLSILGPPVKVQVLPGSQPAPGQGVFLAGNPIPQMRSDGTIALFTTTECTQVTLRLMSKSVETFFIESVDIIRRDGTTLDVPNNWPDIEPESDLTVAIFFAPGQLGATESFRIRFVDATGRRWERINREPVRRLRARTGFRDSRTGRPRNG